MSVPVLEAIADAIYSFEGNRPTNMAYRNRNPGNLRASKWPHTSSTQDYCVFRSFLDGYGALLEDLRAKVTGQNSHGLNLNSTLLQLFAVYAPAGDHNKPDRYAAFVAACLRQLYVAPVITPSITLRDLYAVAGQEPPDVFGHT